MSSYENIWSRLKNAIEIIELNIKKCSKKYRDKNEIDELYSNLTNFLLQDEVSESRLFDELAVIERELRRSGNYHDVSKRLLDDFREKVRHLNTELKSLKTMLDKSSSTWSKYYESADLLMSWFDQQEKFVHDQSAGASNDCLNGYQRYQRVHAQFCEATNFLLQVSDAGTAASIKENVIQINRRWKAIQDRLKQSASTEQMLKYYECEQSLHLIVERLSKIEHFLQKQFKCDYHSIAKYQDEMQKVCIDLDYLEANIKLLNKLATRVELKGSSAQLMSQLMEGVQTSEQRLAVLRQQVPAFQRNLLRIASSVAVIEDEKEYSLSNIERWILDGESILKTDHDQLNAEQIARLVDKEKKHFSEIAYHENAIANKLQQIQNIKAVGSASFDCSEICNRVYRIKESFENLNHRRQKWEESFCSQQVKWQSFHFKTKQLEEWISQAQKIVSEKNDDFNFLIHKHKEFFDYVNDELLDGFLCAGQQLLHIKNEKDKHELRTLMDTLQGQWKMILTHAPVRLLKLQFKRLETLLRQEISAADDEISDEFDALDQKNANIDDIIRRHEAKFKNSDFFATCESYLQGLRGYTKELVEKKIDDHSNIENVLEHLQGYWCSLTQKIEAMNERLHSLPDSKKCFDRCLHELSTWANELTQASDSLNDNGLSSTFEYKRALERTQVLLDELEIRKDQLEQLLKEYDYLEHQRVINELTRSQVSSIHKRFGCILDTVSELRNRIECVNQVVGICTSADNIAGQLRSLNAANARNFMAKYGSLCKSTSSLEQEPADEAAFDESLQAALDEQQYVIEQMKACELEIQNLNRDALECTNASMVHLPSIVHEKLTNAQDILRQCLNEETERRAGLMDMMNSNDQKRSKLDALCQNVELIQRILSHKNPNEPLSTPRKSEKRVSFCSTQETAILVSDNTTAADIIIDQINGGQAADNCSELSFEFTSVNMKHKDYVKSLERLRKCREIVSTSKRLLGDLKFSCSSSSSSSTSASAAAVRRSQSSSPVRTRTPPANSFQQKLKDIEARLCAYESETEAKIETYEQNLARQSRIDQHLSEVHRRLVDLFERVHSTKRVILSSSSLSASLENLSHAAEDMEAVLRTKYSRLREDCELIDKLSGELSALASEKAELLREELSASRMSNLSSSCCDLSFDLDLRKAYEIDSALVGLKDELTVAKLKCSDRLEIVKGRLDEASLSKKQRKLDELSDTLNLQLDSLVSLKLSREKEAAAAASEWLNKSGCSSVGGGGEDLFGESANVLLDKVVLDDSCRSASPAGRLGSASDLAQTRRSAANTPTLSVSQHHAHSRPIYSLRVAGSGASPSCRVGFYSTRNSCERLSAGGGAAAQRPASPRSERQALQTRSRSFDASTFRQKAANFDQPSTFSSASDTDDLELNDGDDEVLDIKLVHTTCAKKRRVRNKALGADSSSEDDKTEEVVAVDYEINAKGKQIIEANQQRRVEDKPAPVMAVKIEASVASAPPKPTKSLPPTMIPRPSSVVANKALKIEMELERQRKEKELEKQRTQVPEHERLVREREERIRCERERAEQDKCEKLRQEKERLERERLERERLYREREERQKAERERQERERAERDRAIKEKNEQMRLERERVVRERAERQRLEKERAETERQERELGERQRRERADKDKAERSRSEKERVERERVEREQQRARSLERERLLEKERLERVEKEKERLKQERAALMTAELERARLAAQALKEQREREEADYKRRLAAEEEERCRRQQEQRERQQQLEMEAAEQESRRRRLDQLESERGRQQEKLKIEHQLKELCERYKDLKEQLCQLNTCSSHSWTSSSCEQTSRLIDQFEAELESLNARIADLSFALHSHLNSSSSKTTTSTTLDALCGLDQAAYTQYELIKSFSNHLALQIEQKKKEHYKRVQTMDRLAELEHNLKEYIQLGCKYLDKGADAAGTDGHHQTSYVQSLCDLENRIDSIESIECSIQSALKQINELMYVNGARYDWNQSNSLGMSCQEIESSVLHPLSQHCADLKEFLFKWQRFDADFADFKDYLHVQVDVDFIYKSSQANDSELERFLAHNDTRKVVAYLVSQLGTYSSYRDKLVRRLDECQDLFVRGSVLFDSAQSEVTRVLAPQASKELKETRELVNDLLRHLDDRCTRLRALADQFDKISRIELTQLDIRDAFEAIVALKDAGADAKTRLARLNELKRRINALNEEKEKFFDCAFDATSALNETTCSATGVHSSSDADTSVLRGHGLEQLKSLDMFQNELENQMAQLENELHKEVMRSLPSRSALDELTDWIRHKTDCIEGLSLHLTSSAWPVQNSFAELEAYKRQLRELSDEMLNERERSLHFIREAVEAEIRQGFYDLAICEQTVQLEREWCYLKQRIVGDLERVDMCLFKMRQFESDVRQMSGWIKSQTQIELASLPSSTSTTLSHHHLHHLERSTSTGLIEDDKRMLAQICAHKETLGKLESTWRQRQTDDTEQNEMNGSLNDNNTGTIVSDSGAGSGAHRLGLIPYEFIAFRLDEIKTSLNKMERIAKLKIDSNLSQLKQVYATRMNELNASLESEVNFVNHGKVISLQQYSSAVRKIKDMLESLGETREQMKLILNKFESELRLSGSSEDVRGSGGVNEAVKDVLSMAKSTIGLYDTTGLLDSGNMKPSSNILVGLTNRSLEAAAVHLVEGAERELMPLWAKYEDMYEALKLKLNDTHRGLMEDIDNLEMIVVRDAYELGAARLDTLESDAEIERASGLLRHTSTQLACCRDSLDTFAGLNARLSEKLAKNENILRQLEQNRELVGAKLSDLSAMYESSMRQRYLVAIREHQVFVRLHGAVCALIDKSAGLLTRPSIKLSCAESPLPDAVACESPLDASVTNRSLKDYALELEELEQRLREALGKLKQLDIRDAERLSKIVEITGPCTQMLNKLRETRMETLDCIQERDYLLQSKFKDVESFVKNYVNRRDEEFRFIGQPPDNVSSETSLVTLKSFIINEFAKLINGIRYMLGCDPELAQCERQLNELRLEMAAEHGASASSSSLVAAVEDLKERIFALRKQISHATVSGGFYDKLIELSSLIEQTNVELDATSSGSGGGGGGEVRLAGKLDSLKQLNDRFHAITECLERLMSGLCDERLNFVDPHAFKHNYLIPLEYTYSRMLNDYSSFSQLSAQFVCLSKKIEAALNDYEERIFRACTAKIAPSDVVGAHEANRIEYQQIEEKFNCLRELKASLCGCGQLKADMEALRQLGTELDRQHQLQMKPSSADVSPRLQAAKNGGGGHGGLSYELLRIKHLDLSCKLDAEMKRLECEFSNWRLIAKKSQKLVDLIKYVHEKLALISMSPGRRRGKSARSRSRDGCGGEQDMDATIDIDREADLDAGEQDCVGGGATGEKKPSTGRGSPVDHVQLRNNRTLNQQLRILKHDLLERLNDHEPIKQEILELCARVTPRSDSIRQIVDHIIVEWHLAYEKVSMKLEKFENFKRKLNELDTKLNEIRERCFAWEHYLSSDCFIEIDLNNYQQILSKKNELEEFLECLKRHDAETQRLFKVCAFANRAYLNANPRYKVLIDSLRERWANLRILVKEKILTIQNIWLLMSDLNDQIENFYTVLNKTEAFYRNIFAKAPSVNCLSQPSQYALNNNILKLIEELYKIIQEDYKLIKYLNESYVNIAKLTHNYALIRSIENFKERLLCINGHWDALHNEIAVKIKMIRKHQEVLIATSQTTTPVYCPSGLREKLAAWLKGIDLSITNLEHLSTKELQMKSSEVAELKKEIAERTECLFKKDSVLMGDESLIDRMQSTMKRIMRLDSYIQQSLPAAATATSKSPSLTVRRVPTSVAESRPNYYTRLKKCSPSNVSAWPRIKAMLN